MYEHFAPQKVARHQLAALSRMASRHCKRNTSRAASSSGQLAVIMRAAAKVAISNRQATRHNKVIGGNLQFESCNSRINARYCSAIVKLISVSGRPSACAPAPAEHQAGLHTPQIDRHAFAHFRLIGRRVYKFSYRGIRIRTVRCHRGVIPCSAPQGKHGQRVLPNAFVFSHGHGSTDRQSPPRHGPRVQPFCRSYLAARAPQWPPFHRGRHCNAE